MVSTYLTEGKCGEFIPKFFPLVELGHSGKFINANNAEMSVNTFTTPICGVERPLITGIEPLKGIKAPVSVGKTNNAGPTEALTGIISCEATHETGGGTKGGKKPKVA